MTSAQRITLNHAVHMIDVFDQSEGHYTWLYRMSVTADAKRRCKQRINYARKQSQAWTEKAAQLTCGAYPMTEKEKIQELDLIALQEYEATN